MGSIFLAFVLPALISAIAGIGLGIGQNVANTKSVESTNDANLQAVRETNASNVEQANLAYQRSLPINQVKGLMDAGMSRAGALNKLTGGGTYTAPVLQSSHGDAPQMDFSGIASSIERLSGVPSNVEQHKMMKLQRDNLEQEMRLRDSEELRKQEQHTYDMWLKTYGKNATVMIDNLSSKIVSLAADKGINLDDIDSTDKLVKAFDLGNDATWRTMPAQARSQVLEGVRLQAAENRANESSSDAHRAAEDTHKLSQKQIDRLIQEIDDFNAAKSAREKEYAARRVKAQLEQDASVFELGMSLGQSLRVFEHDKDGNIVFGENGYPKFIEGLEEHNKDWSKVRNFWQAMFEVFPVTMIGTILKGILK